MRNILLFGLLTILALIGCGRDEEENTTEHLAGTYCVFDPAFVSDKIDSVTLTIENNVRYKFVHFPFRPGRVVDICNSSGTVEEFGTNFAIFFPESIERGGCDSMRVPNGSFVADFQNHGDTIFLDGQDDSLAFEIRLMAR